MGRRGKRSQRYHQRLLLQQRKLTNSAADGWGSAGASDVADSEVDGPRSGSGASGDSGAVNPYAAVRAPKDVMHLVMQLVAFVSMDVAVHDKDGACADSSARPLGLKVGQPAAAPATRSAVRAVPQTSVLGARRGTDSSNTGSVDAPPEAPKASATAQTARVGVHVGAEGGRESELLGGQPTGPPSSRLPAVLSVDTSGTGKAKAPHVIVPGNSDLFPSPRHGSPRFHARIATMPASPLARVVAHERSSPAATSSPRTPTSKAHSDVHGASTGLRPIPAAALTPRARSVRDSPRRQSPRGGALRGGPNAHSPRSSLVADADDGLAFGEKLGGVRGAPAPVSTAVPAQVARRAALPPHRRIRVTPQHMDLQEDFFIVRMKQLERVQNNDRSKETGIRNWPRMSPRLAQGLTSNCLCFCKQSELEKDAGDPADVAVGQYLERAIPLGPKFVDLRSGRPVITIRNTAVYPADEALERQWPLSAYPFAKRRSVRRKASNAPTDSRSDQQGARRSSAATTASERSSEARRNGADEPTDALDEDIPGDSVPPARAEGRDHRRRKAGANDARSSVRNATVLNYQRPLLVAAAARPNSPPSGAIDVLASDARLHDVVYSPTRRRAQKQRLGVAINLTLGGLAGDDPATAVTSSQFSRDHDRARATAVVRGIHNLNRRQARAQAKAKADALRALAPPMARGNRVGGSAQLHPHASSRPSSPGSNDGSTAARRRRHGRAEYASRAHSDRGGDEDWRVERDVHASRPQRGPSDGVSNERQHGAVRRTTGPTRRGNKRGGDAVASGHLPSGRSPLGDFTSYVSSDDDSASKQRRLASDANLEAAANDEGDDESDDASDSDSEVSSSSEDTWSKQHVFDFYQLLQAGGSQPSLRDVVGSAKDGRGDAVSRTSGAGESKRPRPGVSPGRRATSASSTMAVDGSGDPPRVRVPLSVRPVVATHWGSDASMSTAGGGTPKRAVLAFTPAPTLHEGVVMSTPTSAVQAPGAQVDADEDGGASEERGDLAHAAESDDGLSSPSARAALVNLRYSPSLLEQRVAAQHRHEFTPLHSTGSFRGGSALTTGMASHMRLKHPHPAPARGPLAVDDASLTVGFDASVNAGATATRAVISPRQASQSPRLSPRESPRGTDPPLGADGGPGGVAVHTGEEGAGGTDRPTVVVEEDRKDAITRHRVLHQRPSDDLAMDAHADIWATRDAVSAPASPAHQRMPRLALPLALSPVATCGGSDKVSSSARGPTDDGNDELSVTKDSQPQPQAPLSDRGYQRRARAHGARRSTLDARAPTVRRGRDASTEARAAAAAAAAAAAVRVARTDREAVPSPILSSGRSPPRRGVTTVTIGGPAAADAPGFGHGRSLGVLKFVPQGSRLQPSTSSGRSGRGSAAAARAAARSTTTVAPLGRSGRAAFGHSVDETGGTGRSRQRRHDHGHGRRHHDRHHGGSHRVREPAPQARRHVRTHSQSSSHSSGRSAAVPWTASSSSSSSRHWRASSDTTSMRSGHRGSRSAHRNAMSSRGATASAPSSVAGSPAGAGGAEPSPPSQPRRPSGPPRVTSSLVSPRLRLGTGPYVGDTFNTMRVG